MAILPTYEEKFNKEAIRKYAEVTCELYEFESTEEEREQTKKIQWLENQLVRIGGEPVRKILAELQSQYLYAGVILAEKTFVDAFISGYEFAGKTQLMNK